MHRVRGGRECTEFAEGGEWTEFAEGERTEFAARPTRRNSIPLAAVVGDERVAACEREHDLAADAGRGLAAAVGEDDDAEALSRDHADIGRGVAQPAVLVDEGE